MPFEHQQFVYYRSHPPKLAQQKVDDFSTLIEKTKILAEGKNPENKKDLEDLIIAIDSFIATQYRKYTTFSQSPFPMGYLRTLDYDEHEGKKGNTNQYIYSVDFDHASIGIDIVPIYMLNHQSINIETGNLKNKLIMCV